MAEEDNDSGVHVEEKLHGEPLQVPMHTREDRVRGIEPVEVELKFYLDMRKWGMDRIEIPDKNVPSRWLATMVTAITKGPDAMPALEAPSKNPQPNDSFGKLIPSPHPKDKEEGNG